MLTNDRRVGVMTRLGRAMADPTRGRILATLLAGPGYPATLSRDLGLTRSNVSNHLACLLGCGLVSATPEGRQTRYDIVDPHLIDALHRLVDALLSVDDGRACDQPECTVGCCVAVPS